jgi:hypothetical protein
MTCVVQTPSDQTPEASETEDPYRSMLRQMLQEGLSKLRWAWPQSIAPALREELGTDDITPMLVQSIVREAETKGYWAQGWYEAQLAEARTDQRQRKPRSRYKFVARGEQAGNSSLTDAEVRDIRRKYAARYKRLAKEQKLTIKKLADEYKVVPMTIRRILHRETWSHLP